MFFRKKREARRPLASRPTSDAQPAAPALATEKIVVREADGGPKPVRRAFPGPRGADAALRVATEPRAFAELVAHAKGSLDREVCGVLVGNVCEDDEGVFIHVEAVIRGTAASEARTHVTFTQKTWNDIHKVLEHDFPKLRIVGWYHTHPGFGVEFSDMDLFIQRNFFSGPAQIALVTDPLNGAVAICVNTPQGPRYLPRFWVDGREHPCRAPESVTVRTESAGGASTGESSDAIQRLEARVGQLMQVVEEQRASQQSFLLMCGMVFCLGIILVAGYVIYSQFRARIEPPKNVGFMPVPVQIGDKSVLLGVEVVKWDVPPELDVMQQAVEKVRRELMEQLAKQLGTNPAALSNLVIVAPNAPPPPTNATAPPKLP